VTNRGEQMKRSEYFSILLDEWLARDFDYQKWEITRDEDLKTRIEERYKIFELELISPEKIEFSSYLVRRYQPPPSEEFCTNPDERGPPRPGQPFSSDLVLSINLDKLSFSSDWGYLLEEVRDFVKFELSLREDADAFSTALNYRPRKETFLRDLEIFKFWERHIREEPRMVAGYIQEKFGVSEASMNKTVQRFKKILWRKHGPQHPTVKPLRSYNERPGKKKTN